MGIVESCQFQPWWILASMLVRSWPPPCSGPLIRVYLAETSAARSRFSCNIRSDQPIRVELTRLVGGRDDPERKLRRGTLEACSQGRR